MIKRTLYFSSPAYLSLRNNQLVVKMPEVEKSNLTEQLKNDSIRTIPIEDIGVVLLDNKQITLTQAVIESLLENNCALITCDSNHLPVGLMLPLCGNKTQNERFTEQINTSIPLNKQLWQQTIKAKIYNQASVLKCYTGATISNMLKWEENVKSGDSDNLEARAAAYYWRNIFPQIKGFTRDREGVFPNNLLNYGYAILRAIIARSLISTGLLPTFGIHHHNRYNAYCLADDIMEPYRPYIDELVIKIINNKVGDILDIDLKRQLLSIPVLDVFINGKNSPLMVATSTTTASLYKCINGEARKIIYPIRDI